MAPANGFGGYAVAQRVFVVEGTVVWSFISEANVPVDPVVVICSARLPFRQDGLCHRHMIGIGIAFLETRGFVQKGLGRDRHLHALPYGLVRGVEVLCEVGGDVVLLSDEGLEAFEGKAPVGEERIGEFGNPHKYLRFSVAPPEVRRTANNDALNGVFATFRQYGEVDFSVEGIDTHDLCPSVCPCGDSAHLTFLLVGL